MNLEFREVTLEDKELINSYLKKQSSRNCTLCFANIYLWTPHYRVTFTVLEDMLVFKTSEEKPSFSYPLGGGSVKAAIDKLMVYCEENNIEFKMYNITTEQFEVIETLYPDMFNIEYDRDNADYVYETERLINLSGKKYHSKKNHINRFKAVNEDWSYEAMTDENIQECLDMANEWRIQNLCDEDELKSAEMCVTLNAIKKRKELELTGGIIRANGRIVAITLGEPLTEDTFVVHIEKAFSDVQGAYPMINREFLAHNAESYKYVNREEDTGAEGLRKAKLSYKPVFMVESGIVTKK